MALCADFSSSDLDLDLGGQYLSHPHLKTFAILSENNGKYGLNQPWNTVGVRQAVNHFRLAKLTQLGRH